jgi:hypothetical protein
MLQNIKAKRVIYKLHISEYNNSIHYIFWLISVTIFDYNIRACVLKLQNHASSYFLIPIQNLHWLQNLAQITEIQVLFVVGGSPLTGTTAVCSTLLLSAIIASL